MTSNPSKNNVVKLLQRSKVGKVLQEFKGRLKLSAGDKFKNKKQAVANALIEARKLEA